MTKKEKVYHSMAEVEKEFFPVIAKEKRDEDERKDPKKYAERIAKEIIEKAMRKSGLLCSK